MMYGRGQTILAGLKAERWPELRADGALPDLLPSLHGPGMGLIEKFLDGSTPQFKDFHQAVAQALAYMVEHFQEEIYLPDLSRQAGASPSHVCRVFRAEVGLSPMRFLTLFRVERAKQLLVKRPGNVTDAGQASGFGDLGTFEREFKKWVGCTPLAYRQQALALSKPSAPQAK